MEQVVQEKMNKIDQGANEMQRSLERDYIRKLQGKAFNCGSRCCDNTTATAEDVQKCIVDCQKPLVQMQGAVKQELERFQSRIQRCMVTCQDEAQDSLSSLGESATKDKFTSCLCNCADEHLKLLPNVKKRLLDILPK